MRRSHYMSGEEAIRKMDQLFIDFCTNEKVSGHSKRRCPLHATDPELRKRWDKELDEALMASVRRLIEVDEAERSALQEKHRLEKEKRYQEKLISRRVLNAQRKEERNRLKPASKSKSKKALKLVESGIYRISGSPLDKAGMICYIGRAEDLERRKQQHLTGDDPGSILLLETIKAKGAEPIFTVLIKAPLPQLSIEERRWMNVHENSGWVLWNKRIIAMPEVQQIVLAS